MRLFTIPNRAQFIGEREIFENLRDYYAGLNREGGEKYETWARNFEKCKWKWMNAWGSVAVFVKRKKDNDDADSDDDGGKERWV